VNLPPLQLDHLVVAASTLAQGVAWCQDTFGVMPAVGGKHALMGTHNRLLKIETSQFEQAYLEIIAIDPDSAGPAAGRSRWFGLDSPTLQARLRRAPELVHWVVRSSALQQHRDAWLALGLDPGEAVAASRDTPAGRLSWQILLREDGVPQCGGALPTVIQWQGVHPALAMADSALSLRSLVLRGLPQEARALFAQPGLSLAADPGPALTATLSGPRGEFVLSTGSGTVA